MTAYSEPDVCTGCGRLLDDDSTEDGRCGPCARADARLLDWGAEPEPEPVAPVAARPSTRITADDVARITGEAAAPTPATQPSPPLKFKTAAEIRASTPERTDWLVERYVPARGVVLIPGRPKVGKSRFALEMAGAIAGNAPTFIGAALKHGPMVYLSEENAATLRWKLPATDRLVILTREAAWPKPPWAELIAQASAKADEIGAVALIVDTLPHWASMPAEREKDAGAALGIMEALTRAADAGRAVIALAHTRKGGGEDGEGIRGSSAFAGAVDVILEVEKVEDTPRTRTILALSRYPETPGTTVIELNDADEYQLVSRDEDRLSAQTLAHRSRADADRRAILEALSGSEPLTRGDLEEALDAAPQQWYPVLKRLESAGEVVRSGGGRKGDPYRWQILCPNAVQGRAQHGAASDPAGGSDVSVCPVRTHTETEPTRVGWDSVRAQNGNKELEPRPGESFEDWEARAEAAFGGEVR